VIEEGVDDCDPGFYFIFGFVFFWFMEFSKTILLNNPFDRFNLVDVRRLNVAVSMMNAETVRTELSMLPVAPDNKCIYNNLSCIYNNLMESV